ncbi:RNA-guided pseudouridylation complex pseudouridine synthase subunit Cbf5 [Halovenus rubra]|uniref:RNA-guided pseudouridylation complex pseudouridine synthase subunit Cbf5 n=2 Tax=Halovenus rubra TaxID=869890 RepID=A0ACC7E3K3_9EURY|nr:RNA-guided pseudouridylation complex pseudouridine synthase subunit Cbf5 [Halovenus rubra]
MLPTPPEDRSPAELLSFGVVSLDKPPGPSSHEVADWTQDLIAEALAAAETDHTVDRVAHAGTLDPKVTGSLPLLLGRATRIAQVFDDSVKEYVAVLECHGPLPSDVTATLSEFVGDLYQKPPRKSAVKRQLRVRTVHDIAVLDEGDRQLLLRVRCEAGTYIRKLCHDIGLALGTGAHMGDLRRAATGRFDDTDLVTMEDFADALAFWTEDGNDEPLREVVSPAERALAPLGRVTIAPSAAEEVTDGAPVYAPGVIDVSPPATGDTQPSSGDLVACYTPNGAAICLGRFVGSAVADSGTVVELERVVV